MLAVCRLTDRSLFAVFSYLSGGWGDVFGVAVVLLPVAKQRPVQLQVTPWPRAAAAFELDAFWQSLETLYAPLDEIISPHIVIKSWDTAADM